MGSIPAILHFTSNYGHQVELTVLQGGDELTRSSHVETTIKQAFLNAYGIDDAEVTFLRLEQEANVEGRTHGEIRIDGKRIPARYYDLNFPATE